MTVYAITDTKKGRTGIAPTYLQTTLYYLVSHQSDYQPVALYNLRTGS